MRSYLNKNYQNLEEIANNQKKKYLENIPFPHIELQDFFCNELMNEIYKDSQDYTKWEMTDRLANVYNRLVIYRGDYFHASLDYFGRDQYDGRLFQTFFFNTEM